MSDLVEIIEDAIHDCTDGDGNVAIGAAAENVLQKIEKAGYRIVPVEPTEEILLAILMAQFLNDTRETYAAMLSAAPRVT